jgi:dUTP pyrophosphatase
MNVNIKKTHQDAIIPSYAKDGDAGLDLTAISVVYDDKEDVLVYDIGIAIEIPKGYVGLIYPRSSISKKGLTLTNCVGVIDSGYRGNITFKYRVNAIYWAVSKLGDFQSRLNDGFFEFYENAEDELNDDGKGRFAKQTDVYKPTDRVGQLIIMPYPEICFTEVDKLSDTNRGDNGYGSTGE